MTDLSRYPLIDDFETELAQAWDGNTGLVYLNTAPGFTFPVGITTYIVVDPGNSKMQVAEINAVNPTLNTVTVNDATIDKGASLAYAQQTHPQGSIVRISTNYAFWKDIADAINSKVDTNSDNIQIGYFANAAARDAYWPSPVNGYQAYLVAEGKWTDRVAGAWSDRASGTNPNADTTTAGKVEISTGAENTAGTSIGGSGASLSATPGGLATVLQSGSWVYCSSSTGSDTYTANLTPALTIYTTGMLIPCKFTTANTGACSLNLNSLGVRNIKTKDGNDPQSGVIRANGTAILMYDGTNFVIQSEDIASVSNFGIAEMLTDAEALAFADQQRFMNAYQALLTQDITVTNKVLFNFIDDFLNAPSAAQSGLVQFVSGAGAGVSAAYNVNDITCVGWATIGTGTTATGFAGVATDDQSILLGGGLWTWETRIDIEDLSTAGERYQLLAGFLENSLGGSTTQSIGAFFLYDEGGVSTGSAASANRQIVTCNAGARTYTTTSTAVVTDTWVKLKIIVNAAASSIGYYVNGTLVGTITTNIPNAASGNELGFGTLIKKSVGLTSRIYHCDYIAASCLFTTPR